MTKSTIALFSNQLDNRGTGRALIDYAYLLTSRGYKVKIVTRNSHISEHPRYTYSQHRLLSNFETIAVDTLQDIQQIDCDIFYKICSGAWDGIYHSKAKNVIHGVFEKIDDGGNDAVKAYVSEWLANKNGSESFVPHIIYKTEQQDFVFNEMSAFDNKNPRLVVGRIGGYDTFDLDWVKQTVLKLVKEHPDKFVFDFVNTKPFHDLKFAIELNEARNSSLRFRDAIYCDIQNQFNMQQYIKYSDCMLHARERGETFGISVGEFSIQDKPVIFYDQSPEKHHNIQLNNLDKAFIYRNREQLEQCLMGLWDWKQRSWQHRTPGEFRGYSEFDSDSVIHKFEEVFIN